MKANLSWSRTRAKFCQLMANISMIISFFFVLKVRHQDLKFDFVSWVGVGRITNKPTINGQNFAGVRLQLKFASMIRALCFIALIPVFIQVSALVETIIIAYKSAFLPDFKAELHSRQLHCRKIGMHNNSFGRLYFTGKLNRVSYVYTQKFWQNYFI